MKKPKPNKQYIPIKTLSLRAVSKRLCRRAEGRKEFTVKDVRNTKAGREPKHKKTTQ